jgi:hypothetical protein
MAMTDDPKILARSNPSRSRTPSPPLRHISSTDSNSSNRQLPQQPAVNGTPDGFQIPRYNFPSNLVLNTIRRQNTVNTSPFKSTSTPATPILRASESGASSGPSHVTETHHITKDYDERTGAKTINRYEFHNTIGRGVHGKVKLAKDIETGDLVAIKIVNRVTRKRLGRWDPMEAEHKIRREIAIMKKCIHPNVVALREVMDDPDSKKIYLGSSPVYVANGSIGVYGWRTVTMAGCR